MTLTQRPIQSLNLKLHLFDSESDEWMSLELD